MAITASFFWYVGYWVLLGIIHDQEDEGSGFTLTELVVWLFYPVLLPFMIFASAVQQLLDYALGATILAGDKIYARRAKRRARQAAKRAM